MSLGCKPHLSSAPLIAVHPRLATALATRQLCQLGLCRDVRLLDSRLESNPRAIGSPIHFPQDVDQREFSADIIQRYGESPVSYLQVWSSSNWPENRRG
jgi:hypothetical protein